jgi:ADP-heptose:LPS heptosyltransferase
VRRRILFVIRTKLGDSLASFASVLAYVEARPDDDVSVLLTKDYVRIVSGERMLRFIPFARRVEMFARLLLDRLLHSRYDALAVLFGFDQPIIRVAQIVAAKRKIYMTSELKSVYPEYPMNPSAATLADPAWSVVRLLAPEIKRPSRLRIPSLEALRQQTAPHDIVGIVPLADEYRKLLDYRAVRVLVEGVRARYPKLGIWVFVNPRDKTANELLKQDLPPGAMFRTFRDLRELVQMYTRLHSWHGTDTGLYHLAVAMGIPATVYFGPTQPHRVVLPGQSNAVWVRLSALQDSACDILDCKVPVCLHRTIANSFCDERYPQLGVSPQGCPLRRVNEASIDENTRWTCDGGTQRETEDAPRVLGLTE